MAAITVSCPSCSSSFPVDPKKVPEGGVNARCSYCGDVFRVEKPDPAVSVADLAPEPAAAPPQAAGPETRTGVEAQPEIPPLEAPPPIPEEPAKREPLTEAPSPGAPEPPTGPSREAPAEAPTAESATDPGDLEDPFAQTAPFEEAVREEPKGEPQPPVEEMVAEPLPEPREAESLPEPREAESLPQPTEAESLPEPAGVEPLPEPAPAEPLPPLEGAETLPAPEADDTGAPSPQPTAPEPGEPEPAEEVARTTAPPVQGFTFGKRDPKDKAKRLARVLVSDMIMYNAERHQSALANDTLEEDFEEEIEKSWKEFVEQVGEELAEGEGRQYWTDALNDILAKGEKVF